MNTNKNLNINEIFNLAIKSHQEGKTVITQELYNQILKIDPNHSATLNNLGAIFKDLGENQKAKKYYEKAIKINPNYVNAHNNLGVIFQGLGENQKAKDCYEKAIEIDPNHLGTLNNLGVIFKELGETQKAINCYEKAIEINPNYADPHNNLGVICLDLGKYQKAKDCFEKAIGINPNLVTAYWNLHGLSPDIDDALLKLKRLYKIDSHHIKSKIMISVLEAYKGNFSKFNDLLTTPDSDHAYVRSAKWAFSLPQLPEIFFYRWLFFDAVIKLGENSRPFYEFGVWSGVSFKYLSKTFKKGFGFDTFSGLPENWHEKSKGTYSSFGVVPKIEGGEFIVGKFEDTLPNFFSKERPMASIINFDADLYSSTLCALNNSIKVIDEKTILIFDEFLMNNKWEEDEFKALNEFCDNKSYSYDVIAISFFTKQVAVKLRKKQKTKSL
jgi:tetratricopeptide (TPR) repeat protein